MKYLINFRNLLKLRQLIVCWAIFHFSCLGSAKFIEEKQKYGFFFMHVALPFVMSELIIDILAYWKS